jgi:hypothetical protein
VSLHFSACIPSAISLLFLPRLLYCFAPLHCAAFLLPSSTCSHDTSSYSSLAMGCMPVLLFFTRETPSLLLPSKINRVLLYQLHCDRSSLFLSFFFTLLPIAAGCILLLQNGLRMPSSKTLMLELCTATTSLLVLFVCSACCPVVQLPLFICNAAATSLLLFRS